MAKLVFILTGDDWEVHKAGCQDVTRKVERHQCELPNEFEADSREEVFAHVIDQEMRDMGYNRYHCRIFPCTGLKSQK